MFGMSRLKLVVTVAIVVDVALFVGQAALPFGMLQRVCSIGFPVLTALLMWWWLEVKVLRQLRPRANLMRWRPWWQLLIGVALGIGVIAAAVIPAWVSGGFSDGPGYQVYAEATSADEDVYRASRSAGSLGTALLQRAEYALAEEVMFRAVAMGLLGILFFWLARIIGKPAHYRLRPDRISDPQAWRWNAAVWFWSGLAANLLVAALFAAAHLVNPNTSTLSTLNLFIGSLALGQLFWLQGNVLGAWMYHTFFNLAQVALGLPISGVIRATGPLIGFGFSGARPGLLTGGLFGLEASLTVGLLEAAVFAALLYLSWRSVPRASAKES